MANTPRSPRKKVKKHVVDGMAHIHASFNNTIVTITDRQGNAKRHHGPVGCRIKARPPDRRTIDLAAI